MYFVCVCACACECVYVCLCVCLWVCSCECDTWYPKCHHFEIKTLVVRLLCSISVWIWLYTFLALLLMSYIFQVWWRLLGFVDRAIQFVESSKISSSVMEFWDVRLGEVWRRRGNVWLSWDNMMQQTKTGSWERQRYIHSFDSTRRWSLRVLVIRNH